MIKLRNVTYSVIRCCKTRLTLSKKNLEVKKLFSSSTNSPGQHKVLGIETSCDDTGAAVVDEYGNILGNALHSQTSISVA